MFFLLVAEVMLFIGCTFLGGIMDKQSAFDTTALTSTLSETGMTVYVKSTQRFPASGYVWIEDEYIRYSSKTTDPTTFVVWQSGTKTGRAQYYGNTKTDAESHSIEKLIMTDEAKDLNVLMGVQIVQAEGVLGTTFAFASFAWSWVKALPKFLMWDYSFVDSISYLRPFLYAISIGFLVVMGSYIKGFFFS